MPKIFINNQEVITEGKTTILEAAESAGIKIPTLCYLSYPLDIFTKIPFFEFHSSANLKSYFRGLEIHVQNFCSLSLLATQRQACKISTDNGSTAVLTISQQCAGFKLFCIFQFKHIQPKTLYPKNLLSMSTLHLAPVSFLKSCILYL